MLEKKMTIHLSARNRVMMQSKNQEGGATRQLNKILERYQDMILANSNLLLPRLQEEYFFQGIQAIIDTPGRVSKYPHLTGDEIAELPMLLIDRKFKVKPEDDEAYDEMVRKVTGAKREQIYALLESRDQ